MFWAKGICGRFPEGVLGSGFRGYIVVSLKGGDPNIDPNVL